MTKYQFYFLFFLLTNLFGVCSLGFAQNTDSLLQVARTEKSKKNFAPALRNYLQVMKLWEKEQATKTGVANKKLAPLYVEIGQIYEQSKLHDNAIAYFKKANALDEQANTNELIANELLNSNKNKEALESYQKALAVYQKHNDYAAIIRNLSQLMTCYQNLNQYDKALETGTEIVTRARQVNDSKTEMIALNNLGYVYRYLRNYSKAFETLNKVLALKFSLQTSPQEKIITLTNLGVVSQNLGNYTNALEYLLQALQLAEKQKLKPEICKLQDLIAVVYLNNKDIYNAESSNDFSIDLAEKLKDAELLQEVYKTKSDILQAKEDYQEALNFYKKHLNLRDSLTLAQTIAQQELLQQQFAVERDEKNTLDAISNEEARKAALQQLQNEVEKQKLAIEKQKETQRADAERAKAAEEKQIANQEIAERELKILKQQNEAEQRERQFLALEKEKAVQALELEKQKAQEKETQRQVTQLKQDKEIQDLRVQQQALATEKQARETRLLYAILAAVLLLIVIGIIAYFNIRKKNSQLAQQKNEIELKNVELEQTQEEIKAQRDALEVKKEELNYAYNNIKASITYAKRIQAAILPPLPNIQVYLPEIFILFKPRDIVSGDFYWFAPTSETSCVLAAVDCTGHGVPGAFMSMIGDSLLNQIVIENHITSPDLILAALNKGIKNSLRKGEQDAKDGMDMAICWVDKAQQLIEWAGAMNPACVVQNGELREIKADKKPIGDVDTEGFCFTKHIISCEVPTTVYLYSDGYQDQFGGAEGRKFMIRRFRNLLADIHTHPMPTQKEILEDTLANWLGTTHTQIDDILVIGFRLG